MTLTMGTRATHACLTVAIMATTSSCLKSNAPTNVQTVTVAKAHYWRSNWIPVCWENSGNTTKDMRIRVQNFVQSEFSKTTLRLVGWGKCTDGIRGMRLFIYDDPDIAGDNFLQGIKKQLKIESRNAGHPHVRAWGNELDGKVAGVVLTYNFEEINESLKHVLASLPTRQAALNLVDSVVLHELGHGIGLQHEDSHPQRTCDDFGEGLDGGIAITPYNFESVMNRCFYRNYDYRKGKLGFTPGDIAGIAAAYPR